MKNTRALVMIVISVVVALAAVWLASRWVSEQVALSTTKVVVAAADIDIGGRLTRENVRAVDWPAGNVPAGAAKDESLLIDRVARTSLQRGEAILESKLAPVGAVGGLAAIVSEGKRAMTVAVSESTAVAGFVRPGAFVDVIVNTEEIGTAGAANAKDRSISKIVLEHVLVLAVAQEANRDETKPKVVSAVTLEVTPEQAEILDLARSVGALSLVLRNQVDPKPVVTAGATKPKLLSGAAAARTPAAVPKVVAVPMPPTKVVARKPAAAPGAVAVAPRRCVTVITGIEDSRECF